MAITMRQLKDIRKKYCSKCHKNCTECNMKDFMRYIGTQYNNTYSIEQLMKTNMPVDVTHRSGKYKQNSKKVFK